MFFFFWLGWVKQFQGFERRDQKRRSGEVVAGIALGFPPEEAQRNFWTSQYGQGTFFFVPNFFSFWEELEKLD